MNRRLFSLLCLVLGLAAFGGHVQAQGIAVGLQAGTLGPGVSIDVGLTPRLQVRGAVHAFGYDRSDTFDDEDVELRIDSKASLASGAAFVDLYPFKKVLRLTGGIVMNRNEVTALATPLTGYTIDDKEFAPEKIGTLSATVGHQTSLQPYLGIGFGNALLGSRFGLSLDLGVLYTDAPRVEMEGTGMIAPTADQDVELQDDLSGIKLFPHVALGLTFRVH